MAEAVFAHKVAQAGLADRFEIDSCGTGHWHIGNPPHAGTRKQLSDHGIPTTHKARVIREQDLVDFDYVIVMDDSNYSDVSYMGEAKGVFQKMTDYDPSLGYNEVPDPYYTGKFDEVFSLVDRLSDKMLEAIRSERGF